MGRGSKKQSTALVLFATFAATAGANAPAAVADRVAPPQSVAAISEYIEMMPSAQGPKSVASSPPPAAPLPPKVVRRVQKQVGAKAPVIQHLAGQTSVHLAVPHRRPSAKPSNSAVVAAVGSHSHKLLFLLLGVGGSAVLAAAFAAGRRSRSVKRV